MHCSWDEFYISAPALNAAQHTMGHLFDSKRRDPSVKAAEVGRIDDIGLAAGSACFNEERNRVVRRACAWKRSILTCTEGERRDCQKNVAAQRDVLPPNLPRKLAAFLKLFSERGRGHGEERLLFMAGRQKQDQPLWLRKEKTGFNGVETEPKKPTLIPEGAK